MPDPEGPPIVNITGERVVLGPLSRDLLPTFTRWINDFHALRTLGGLRPGPTTLESEEAWYTRVTTEGDSVTFLIRERLSSVPIGTTGLHRIDFRNRAATFGIMIGEQSARGQGYGTEAARLMLDYAFNAVGLHSVSLTVAEYNIAGQRAYRKAGFRECGRLREHILLGGRMWDQILMDCLANEFESPVLSEIFAPDVPRD
jgi:RimJ/RimL family protein N-acetyltransferase